MDSTKLKDDVMKYSSFFIVKQIVLFSWIAVEHLYIALAEEIHFRYFKKNQGEQYQKAKLSFWFHIHSWKEIFVMKLSVVSWEKRWISNNELRVAIYFTSYLLLLVRELQFTVYCMNYKLLFAWELQITINCTNYELLIAWKAQLLINE